MKLAYQTSHWPCEVGVGHREHGRLWCSLSCSTAGHMLEKVDVSYTSKK